MKMVERRVGARGGDMMETKAVNSKETSRANTKPCIVIDNETGKIVWFYLGEPISSDKSGVDPLEKYYRELLEAS